MRANDSPGNVSRAILRNSCAVLQYEFDLLKLTKISFPQSNYNKSHFPKRTIFLLCGKRRQSSRNPGRFVTSLSLLSIQHGGQQNRSRCFSVRVLGKL